MKKKLCLLPLFALLILALFAGCDSGVYGRYSNASRYSIGGGTAQNVTSVDVDWVGGRVNVLYADVSAVTFSEEADNGLNENDDMLMRWAVEGTTLKIKFAKSGAKLVSGLQKTLTVVLPQGTTLHEIDVDTVSANISCDLNAWSADFESVSGNISYTGTVTNELNFETVSGNVTYATATLPDQIDVETVSGDTYFTFPETASFSVDFDCVSGNLHTEGFSGTQNGKYFVVGGGSTKIEADAVSGDFTIIAFSE